MKKLIIRCVILSMCMFMSCQDVLEEDIEDDQVIAVYPLQNEIVSGNSILFQWQYLDGADDYRVQVQDEVTQVTVIDSLVEGSTTLTMVIDPGMYSWRVRGENFAYQTPYTFPIDFQVVESDDLTNQIVSIVAPSANFYTNDVSNISLNWNGISTADSYTFQLDRTVSNVTNLVYEEIGLTGTTYNVNSSLFTVDAIFPLKVKALNSSNSTETVYSSVSVFYDTESPGNPVLGTPADDADFSVSTAFDFTWSTSGETGEVQSPITYTVEFSTDAAFSTIYASTFSSTTSASYTFTELGTFYWRIIANDEAGNSTVSSNTGFFNII